MPERRAQRIERRRRAANVLWPIGSVAFVLSLLGGLFDVFRPWWAGFIATAVGLVLLVLAAAVDPDKIEAPSKPHDRGSLDHADAQDMAQTSERPKFTQVVRRQYERRRRPTAFVLVLVIVGAQIWSYEPLELAAGLLLLALILELLFEITDRLGEPPPNWYPAFSDAMPFVSAEVRGRLHGHAPVRLRWFGVTQESDWPIAQNLLLWLLDERPRGASLSVELALLAEEATFEALADPVRKWIDATRSSAKAFATAHGTELDHIDSSISLVSYDFRPTWHALLIDDDLLVYSACLPKDFTNSAPQGGAEVVRRGDGPAAADRIRHFESWFNYASDSAGHVRP